MPEPIEQMYCSQQIVVPPKFPYILKTYCKAAIKTQPYDLLRWSFEYFSALAENRPPPVKLRLEYPIYSTEGGLTKGCLKVLANQLGGSPLVSVQKVRAAWKGFCLDPEELNRILCLCEVYLREYEVPFLHFIAVAGGLLTKTLTHTMILLCESLTKEPNGGSAAIPVQDFLTMYKFLATMDASKDVKYFNGYREGITSTPHETSIIVEEEKSVENNDAEVADQRSADDFWQDSDECSVQTLLFTNDHLSHSTRLSLRLKISINEKVERSPSMERDEQIERENYMKERKGSERKLIIPSNQRVDSEEEVSDELTEENGEKKEDNIEITITNEEGKEIIYATDDQSDNNIEYEVGEEVTDTVEAEELAPVENSSSKITEKQRIREFVQNCYEERAARREDLENSFKEMEVIVDKFKTDSYDLGILTGRQMSKTSGEFVVQHIEKDMIDEVNDQIAALPHSDITDKKAKLEDIAMIRDILEKFLDENIDVIVQDSEEVEEEEAPVPEVTLVYCVPGIGAPVDQDIMQEFEEYALEVSQAQANLFMPRNLRHFTCPPLEKYEEAVYDELKKEEVPMAGVITD